MASRAGVFVSEKPTPMLSPVTASAALPVFVGTAPINQRYTKDEVLQGKGLEPVLAFSYEEAVQKLGYKEPSRMGDKTVFMHTLCMAAAVQFGLYQSGPAVFINVFGADPAHIEPLPPEDVPLVDGRLSDETLEMMGRLFLETLVVKPEDESTTYEEGVDYVVSFTASGRVSFALVDGGAIGPDDTLKISGDALRIDNLDPSDMVGGYDALTGRKTGLELVSDVFPRWGLVPGLISVPMYGAYPEIAAVMLAKSQNINGVFRAMSVVPLYPESGYTSAVEVKKDANIFDPQQLCVYGSILVGNRVDDFSPHLTGLIGRTDSDNNDIPYVSPLNKRLQSNGMYDIELESSQFLGLDQANFLLANGIITALNFSGGWRAWGDNTAAYPSNTDPKDSSISNRRMFNWVENSIILTCWQFVGRPMGLPLIQTITDTLNSWFDGLRNSGAIAGGRVEFREASNPTTDLLANRITFDVFVTPTPTAAEINFPVTYDPSYLQFGE